MDARPIPAFYCCYLLRSTSRKSSLYVGSTPNPIRRLAQHNGRIKGGAARTARQNLRPWEIACLVSGFPSQIAALQFEWAWQNSHTTRRIPADERLTEPRTIISVPSSTGRSRRRPARPKASLVDKLSNLHLLLRVESFERWPLEVRFFSEDVYHVWQRWTERVDGQIRDGIETKLDLRTNPLVESQKEEDNGGGEGVEGSEPRRKKRQTARNGRQEDKERLQSLNVDFTSLTPHLEKSMEILSRDKPIDCHVCRQKIHDERQLAVCPHSACETTSHMACLARYFLEREGSDAVIPTSGLCPGCWRRTNWLNVVKELSLRARGPAEVEKLLKRSKRAQAKSGANERTEAVSSTAPELVPSQMTEANDDPSSQWHLIDEEDEEDAVSRTSTSSIASAAPMFTQPPGMPDPVHKNLEIVIEDSDWSGAEVVD